MYRVNNVTPENKRQMVENFLTSGMKRVDFCKENNISTTTLFRWKRDYHQELETSIPFLPLTQKKRGLPPKAV